ncbi:hypothetical protein Agub_g13159 [Astrephomene gubernaculifera]|uniref:HECT-type E3 ubiquitin transferase n=1 Tax=Astrephomene gubernaculifera TaxID=47775 RepID=A0AAD3HS36_9CHLO|nr:hypothetical protein Agub_g13159 [Astrephomene gubernaculifera]
MQQLPELLQLSVQLGSSHICIAGWPALTVRGLAQRLLSSCGISMDPDTVELHMDKYVLPSGYTIGSCLSRWRHVPLGPHDIIRLKCITHRQSYGKVRTGKSVDARGSPLHTVRQVTARAAAALKLPVGPARLRAEVEAAADLALLPYTFTNWTDAWEQGLMQVAVCLTRSLLPSKPASAASLLAACSDLLDLPAALAPRGPLYAGMCALQLHTALLALAYEGDNSSSSGGGGGGSGSSGGVAVGASPGVALPSPAGKGRGGSGGQGRAAARGAGGAGSGSGGSGVGSSGREPRDSRARGVAMEAVQQLLAKAAVRVGWVLEQLSCYGSELSDMMDGYTPPAPQQRQQQQQQQQQLGMGRAAESAGAAGGTTGAGLAGGSGSSSGSSRGGGDLRVQAAEALEPYAAMQLLDAFGRLMGLVGSHCVTSPMLLPPGTLPSGWHCHRSLFHTILELCDQARIGTACREGRSGGRGGRGGDSDEYEEEYDEEEGYIYHRHGSGGSSSSSGSSSSGSGGGSEGAGDGCSGSSGSHGVRTLELPLVARTLDALLQLHAQTHAGCRTAGSGGDSGSNGGVDGGGGGEGGGAGNGGGDSGNASTAAAATAGNEGGGSANGRPGDGGSNDHEDDDGASSISSHSSSHTSSSSSHSSSDCGHGCPLTPGFSQLPPCMDWLRDVAGVLEAACDVYSLAGGSDVDTDGEAEAEVEGLLPLPLQQLQQPSVAGSAGAPTAGAAAAAAAAPDAVATGVALPIAAVTTAAVAAAAAATTAAAVAAVAASMPAASPSAPSTPVPLRHNHNPGSTGGSNDEGGSGGVQLPFGTPAASAAVTPSSSSSATTSSSPSSSHASPTSSASSSHASASASPSSSIASFSSSPFADTPAEANSPWPLPAAADVGSVSVGSSGVGISSSNGGGSGSGIHAMEARCPTSSTSSVTPLASCWDAAATVIASTSSNTATPTAPSTSPTAPGLGLAAVANASPKSHTSNPSPSPPSMPAATSAATSPTSAATAAAATTPLNRSARHIILDALLRAFQCPCLVEQLLAATRRSSSSGGAGSHLYGSSGGGGGGGGPMGQLCERSVWRHPRLAGCAPAAAYQKQVLDNLLTPLSYVYEDDDYDAPVLQVCRSDMLGSSFGELMQYDGYSLGSEGICVSFEDEEAFGDGVLREWLTEVASAVFDPNAGLFRMAEGDVRCLHLCAAGCTQGEQHLELLTFAGRIMGLAMRARVPLGFHLSSALFKLLQHPGRPGVGRLRAADLEQLEPRLAATCAQIAAAEDVEALGLTFVASCGQLGAALEVPLLPRGAGDEVAVTAANRADYLDRLTRFYCSWGCSSEHGAMAGAAAAAGSTGGGALFWEECELDAVEALAQGLADALVFSYEEGVAELAERLRPVSAAAFNAALGGETGGVDVTQWRAHTSAAGFKTERERAALEAFWSVVRSLRPEQQRRLLQFWTGLSHLPAGGFKHLSQQLQLVPARPGEDDCHRRGSSASGGGGGAGGREREEEDEEEEEEGRREGEQPPPQGEATLLGAVEHVSADATAGTSTSGAGSDGDSSGGAGGGGGGNNSDGSTSSTGSTSSGASSSSGSDTAGGDGVVSGGASGDTAGAGGSSGGSSGGPVLLAAHTCFFQLRLPLLGQEGAMRAAVEESLANLGAFWNE